MKEKCDCCGLEIYYDNQRGKPVNVIVLPADSVKSFAVQKAIHRADASILPLACRGKCSGRCQAAAIIAEFQSSKE